MAGAAAATRAGSRALYMEATCDGGRQRFRVHAVRARWILRLLRLALVKLQPGQRGRMLHEHERNEQNFVCEQARLVPTDA